MKSLLSYFNTNKLAPEQVDLYTQASQNQEERVLDIMQFLGEASPSQVHAYFHDGTPETSVRRAMTCLTQKGELFKTDRKVVGPYGRPEGVWKLKR